MINFETLAYERVEIGTWEIAIVNVLENMRTATSAEQQIEMITAYYNLMAKQSTMANLAYVRRSINVKDAFYDTEVKYYDTTNPIVQKYATEYYTILLNSGYRKELETALGKQLFTLAEVGEKTFKPSIIEDLQKENELSSNHSEFIGKAKIVFRGKEYNLSGIIPLLEDKDRQTRKEASEAYWGFYVANQEFIGNTYDEMVKTRTEIAKKLGFDNFLPLAYLRMNRTDYNMTDVQKFREAIHKYVVPICTQLKQQQQSRLGLDTLYYYDESLLFASGNPKPIGDSKELTTKAQKMYHELSEDTGAFFDKMVEGKLLDLDVKENKMPGGYCASFEDFKMPFIFANFKQTSHDVTVLTHEAGHAFQSYSSSYHTVTEYQWPTTEACEIHSMGMEFLTWPWMDSFFGQDTKKFQYEHVSTSLNLLCTCAMIDEFQEMVYLHADWTHEQRNAAYKNIVLKYAPHKNFEENEELAKGISWQRVNHIFSTPFYYIDYALAQLCAFQFWKKADVNRPKAMEEYIKLCKVGGQYSFVELLKYAELDSPFEETTIKSIANYVNDWLQNAEGDKL